MSALKTSARPVRFIHTADLHLDSPLKSLALRDPELARRVGDASRTVLSRLVDTAIEQSVDAVLIAGDLYDGGLDDVRTTIPLEREFRRLESANIPVFLIRGNHDAEVERKPVRGFPDNVHVFDSRGGQFRFANDRAVVHGVSYDRRRTTDSLLPKFHAAVAGRINIGMLHTSLGGHAEHETYAPCTLDELRGFGYDYWALGHIHKREVYSEEPAVVMPGNPLGRHFNESGKRSITLVEFDEQKTATLTPIDIAPVRFERLAFPVEGLSDMADLHEVVESLLDSCTISYPQDLLIVRLTPTGASDLATRLRRQADDLLDTWREMVADRHDLWIDSIDVTRLAGNTHASRARPVSDEAMQALLNDAVIRDPHVRERIVKELEQLARKLPPQLRRQALGKASSDTGDTVLLGMTLDEWLEAGADWARRNVLEDDMAAEGDHAA